MRRPLLRLAAACGAALLMVAGGATGAVAAPAGPTSVALRLAAQTSVVGPGGSFNLEVDVSGATSTDRINVAIYPQLSSRIDFDAAAKGQYGDLAPYGSYESVGDTRKTAQGAAVLSIPVYPEVPAGKQLVGFDPETTSPGVYPLEVQVFTPEHVAVSAPLSTFLVYSPAKTGFTKKLAVSLTVGVNAAPNLSRSLVATVPPASSALALSSLVTTIAKTPHVPVTLDVTPQTVAALATGSAQDKATVAGLGHLAAGGDELVPSPYVSVSLPGLDNAGLDAQIVSQLDAGAAALKSDLDVSPQTATWVANAPLDDSVVQLLAGRGLKQLILPDGDLSALPAADQTTTYAQPTGLNDGAGSTDLRVVGADPVLSARLAPSSDPVLSAEQTLAELAMIALESPNKIRGVAILAPTGDTIQTPLLSALLAGLRHNPLVAPVTASGLFSWVPAVLPSSGGSVTDGSGTDTSTTTVPSSGTAVDQSATVGTVRSLTGHTPAGVPSAVQILALAGNIGAVATVVPGDTALLARLDQQLLISGSDQIRGATRRALLSSASHAVRGVTSQVKLVGATSVTLTARNVHLPLTIQSVPKAVTHVELDLRSSKLMFKAYRPAGGTCSTSGQGVEECQLVLRSDQTTLKVPVEARTTGVFTLGITLRAPGNGVVLTSATDTVRSTAVSFVGWVLIFGACLFLGTWWIRDIRRGRRGRRARQLVQRPDEDGDDADEEFVLDPPPTGHAEPAVHGARLRGQAGSSGPDPAGLRLVPPLEGRRVSPSGPVGGHREGPR